MKATRESIELAARALHERDCACGGDWENLTSRYAAWYRSLAKAAIEAIPDPVCSQCQTWSAMTPGGGS